MKIALLSFEYPPETGFGGIGTYAWYQARALAKLGHEVHVLAGAVAPTALRTSEHDGVMVHRFRDGGAAMERIRRLDGPRLWWTKNRLGNAWSFLRGFDRLLERHAFDVVEFPECGGEGSLIAPLRAVNTVVKFHSPARLIMGCYDVRREDLPLTSLVERLGIEHAGGHLCCSRFAADEIRREMGFERPIEVVANGIDLALFDAEDSIDARARFGLPRDKPLILFCGRMEPRKGIEACPPIVASLLERHDVAFAFAGDDLFGFVEREFKPLLAARTLRGSCHFLGRVPLHEARSLSRQCDLFFMPSRWENCPYACLEAMAASRAVVAARSSGIPELVVDGESGLLASLERPEEFVAVLERLIEDAPLRARLGAAARRRIEAHYTDVEIARRTVAYYERQFGAPPRLCRPAPAWNGEIGEALAATVALIEEAERAPAQPAPPADAAAAARELADARAERDAARRELARAKEEAAAERARASEKAASIEARAGELLVRELGLGPAIGDFLATRVASLHDEAERRLASESAAHPRRLLAIPCREFPVYSQAFVHEELLQLARAGLEPRLCCFEERPASHLAERHRELWERRQRIVADRDLHRRHLAHFRATRPARVDELLARLAAASGLSARDVEHHDNVLEGFTYARLAEAWRPHWIHSYFFYSDAIAGLVASFLLGIPRGITCYVDHVFSDYELKVVPLHLAQCELVVATSQRVRGELLRLAPGVDERKIVVKPNAVRADCFAGLARAEPRAGEPFRVVAVCRIDAKKGLLHAVEATRLLRARGVRVELHVVGEADPDSIPARIEKRRLDDAITAAGLWGTVHLEGRQDEAGLKRFLAISQLFVAPFVETEEGDKDGIPTALLEAMASGLPAVVTDSGSIPEVVVDGVHGRVVPQRDPAALADAIAALLADAPLRARLGAAAAARVREQFDVAACEPLLHRRILDRIG